jgi:hypothetical protein
VARPSRQKSGLNEALTVAIASLMRFAPYSTSSDFKVWKDTVKSLQEVQAGLELLDVFRPGLVNAMLDTAYEEARIGQGETPAEISELIGRYCRKPKARR